MFEVNIHRDDIIAHASEIIKTARSLLFFIIIACFYCLLTILSTTDTELISGAKKAELPIIETEVDIWIFFFVAPWLLVSMQTYFYAYSHKLWRLLVRVSPPSKEQMSEKKSAAGWPGPFDIEQAIHPWLMVDFVRRYQPHMAKASYGLSTTYSRASGLLSWWLIPLTLFVMCTDAAAYGLRTPPEVILSTSYIFALAISIFVSQHFRKLAIAILTCRSSEEIENIEKRKTFSLNSVFLIALYITLSATFIVVFSENPKRWLGFLGADADLVDGELSTPPEGWPGRLTMVDATQTPTVFDATLVSQNNALRKVKRISLRYRDLRGADMTSAFAAKVDFTAAKLRSVRFDGAQLQQAIFNGGVLAESTFVSTDMTRANLIQADVSNARLFGTFLDNANFRQANLTEAEFVGGRFNGTDFSGANLTGAIFRPPLSIKEVIYGSPSIDLRKAIFGTGLYRDETGNPQRVLTIVAGADLSYATLDKHQENLMCSGTDAKGRKSKFPAGFSPPPCPSWVIDKAEPVVYSAGEVSLH